MTPFAAELAAFDEGRHAGLHHLLGARRRPEGAATEFTLWAPHATAAWVIGEFNGWEAGAHPLERVPNTGCWHGVGPALENGSPYKFVLHAGGGEVLEKADPFARFSQLAPGTASRFWHSQHTWGDEAWMEKRAQVQGFDQAINVYELHVGSWRRRSFGELPGWAWLAKQLVPYLLKMGFTHVELMPVMEHPFYGSWGYQTTGYFAPTARYGTPDEFRAFVDTLHQHDLGVLLDWVPSHFPADAHGLAHFDGTALFEHPDPRRGFHPDWKSCIFDYDSPQVRSFLISSAMHWLEEFHIDGIRVDAVASMLYLNYSREEGQWLPNRHGGPENLGAIALLEQLHTLVGQRFPAALMIAEESTAWDGVTRPVDHGGLGFGMKWDMGWMHDTLSYFSKDPVHRKHHHNQLTFRSLYARSEQFMLAISHDEVVYGKGSLLGKMPGDMWQKCANLRLLLGYMHALPGKTLLFMGCEFGQPSEWTHEGQLDWPLLQGPDSPHAALQRWCAAINRLSIDQPALHAWDFDARGFEWICGDDASQSVLTFFRHGPKPEDTLLVACNFTPIPRPHYLIGAPRDSRWAGLLSSDELVYGGSHSLPLPSSIGATSPPHHGQTGGLSLDVPPLAIVFLQRLPS